MSDLAVPREDALRRLGISPGRLRQLCLTYRPLLGALPRAGLSEAQVARLAEILEAEANGRTASEILAAMEPLVAEISLDTSSWRQDQERLEAAAPADWQSALARLAEQQEEQSGRLLAAIVRLQQEVSQLRRVVEEIGSRRSRKGARW